MFYSLIKIWLLSGDIKCRVRTIAQKLRICSLALQSFCSFLHISAQCQMHSYSSRLDRELDFQGCGILPEHLPSSVAFSAHCSLSSCLLSSPHHVSKRTHFHDWFGGLTELNEGIFWLQGAKCRGTMQGSCAAPLKSWRPAERVDMEGTGRGCSLFRRNDNSVQVSSSRGALWVAATGPVSHSFYLLNPCSTCRGCQKDKVPSVHIFFSFNVNINLVGFMSFHTVTPTLWNKNFQSLPNWTFQCLMCEHPVWWYHFCVLPQHPWQCIFLKLEHDTLRGGLCFLMMLWQMSYHPNDVDFFSWCFWFS